MQFRPTPADDIILKLQSWWVHSSGSELFAELARLLPTLICWEIWKARNRAFFEGVVITGPGIIHQVIMGLQLIGRGSPFWCASAMETSLLG